MDRQLKTEYGVEHGLEWFKQNGIAPEGKPGKAYDKYARAFWNKKEDSIPGLL